MTPEKFRQLALSLPEASESQHKNHPDFRVRGKIFATLFAQEDWGVVKLSRELQVELLNEAPDVFEACKGAWAQRCHDSISQKRGGRQRPSGTDRRLA